MAKFNHLKNTRVNGAPVEYIMYAVTSGPAEKPARLKVRPATEVNRDYFNAVMRRSAKAARRVAAGGAIDIAVIAENREHDRDLYPQYVIVGWSDVFDENDQQVPFNPADCEEFLRAIGDWVFDDLRTFCGRSENFTENALSAEEGLALGNG